MDIKEAIEFLKTKHPIQTYLINTVEQLVSKGYDELVWATLYGSGLILSDMNVHELERKCGNLAVTWHANGMLYDRRSMRNGRDHGNYEAYWDNGSIRARGSYINGNAHGMFEYFNSFGKLTNRHCFVHGDMHGMSETFYADESVHERMNFIKNKIHGQHTIWHENGNLWQDATFKDGERCGTFREWKEDGSFSKSIYFIEPKPIADDEVSLEEIMNDEEVRSLEKILIEDLDKDIQKAVDNEDYEMAAKLRDKRRELSGNADQKI
jgi:antitoxin component YwqK of YwqJK toxin-antitoxin module